jgi:hypothetical protein
MNDANVSADTAKFHFKDQDVAYLLPCLDVTLYWTGSVFDRREGVIAFHQRCVDLIGSSFKFFRTETMGRARPLKKDTLGLVPFWFGDDSKRRDIYMLFLESGNVPDEPSDRAFALNASPGMGFGFVRLVLPVDTIEAGADSFRDLALELARLVKPEFGQAGVSVNWNHLGDHETAAIETMTGLAARYPGIDMAHPFSTQFAVSKGIKCINWLTFLGAHFVSRVGGTDELRRSLGGGIEVHDLGFGVAVQAGTSPEIGDVNRRKNLPLYHTVGHALASLRTTEHPPIFGPEGIGDHATTRPWLARFDQ